MLAILLLALLGLALSLYALRVAYGRGGKRMCDLADNVSCTKAFTSDASRTFGIHNAAYGAAFYALVAVLSFSAFPAVLVALCALAVCTSLWLAYVSYVRMRNFCLVCTATYLVNVTLLALALQRM